ncbi:unnamed protein product, partial [Pneumocystis jirovecii]
MALYSSSSDSESGDDDLDGLDSEEQEASGLFLKRRKRHRAKNEKDRAMLGIFMDESDDDMSGLSEKQLRYKHVRFTSSKDLDGLSRLNEKYSTPKESGNARTIDRNKLEYSSGGSKMLHSIPNELQTPKSFGQSKAFKTTNSNTPNHFKSSGFGAKIMEKMGYVAGKGLGSQGQGILNPVETKIRPTRAGLGSIKERTQQDIEESKRWNKEVDEDQKDQYSKSLSEHKQEKKHKEKLKYKTASEIAGGMEVPRVLQQIIDMTGKDVKLIENVSGTMSIPVTLSHNDEMYQISLIARHDLEMYATEWKQLQDRKTYIEMEENRINEKINQESIKIQELERIIEEMEKIELFCRNNPKNSLEILNDVSEMLERIQIEFSEKIETYHLDEVVVSILFPIMRTMTPFENMLQYLWIPKVRLAINNVWDPHNPSSALLLFESWKNLLSPFIQDFILNQLILPKLQKSVSDWNPRNFIKKKDHQLPHIWLFPWLPLLKENTETLIDNVKRKFKIILSSWDIRNGPIEELNAWKEIFGDNQFEKLMLNYLLPKLSTCLRVDFDIDPSDQKLEPLEWVFSWKNFFKPSVFDRLFAADFFPKWMDILYLWLTDSDCNYAQVSEWYQWWQQVFPSEMLKMPMIRESFVKGLDMMNHALNLGKDVSEKLPPPITDFIDSIEAKTKENPLPKEYKKQFCVEDIKFKDVVEEFCAEHDLILIPLRKADENTGNPLFRITASASGTGGIVIYIKDDVVWVQDLKNKNEFSPQSLNHILTLAQRS